MNRPRRTVSRWLRLLVKEGWLVGPVDGLYMFAPGTADFVRDPRGIPGIHGLVLISKDWPVYPLRGTLAKRFGPAFVEAGETRRHNEVFNGRHVGFWFYPTTGQIRIDFPANPDPLHPEELPELLGWLNGVLAPIEAGTLWVVEIGLHTDYPDIQLKGIKAVQLRPCVGAILQIYQKEKDLLRHEAHLFPKDLDLLQAVEAIWGGSPTARLERAIRQELELERLRDPSAGGGCNRGATCSDVYHPPAGWSS